jgi:hypothetical protein
MPLAEYEESTSMLFTCSYCSQRRMKMQEFKNKAFSLRFVEPPVGEGCVLYGTRTSTMSDTTISSYSWRKKVSREKRTSPPASAGT